MMNACKPVRRQRGMTVLVVLVLLSVMTLGGLALARMTEVGTLAAGNQAYRDAALQASEIGINTAYAALRGLADENANDGNWYFASVQSHDELGVPTVNWSSTPELVVGAYRIRYVVDRVCQGALPVTNPMRQCLVKQVPQIDSRTNRERPDPPTARQYRITVRVTGPKDTQSWVQALVTRG